MSFGGGSWNRPAAMASGRRKTESATQETVQEEFDLEAFEEKLAHTISQIQGAGEAQVVLSLQSSSRQVLAQDKEQGSQGDSSTTTVTVGRGRAVRM